MAPSWKARALYRAALLAAASAAPADIPDQDQDSDQSLMDLLSSADLNWIQINAVPTNQAN